MRHDFCNLRHDSRRLRQQPAFAGNIGNHNARMYNAQPIHARNKPAKTILALIRTFPCLEKKLRDWKPTDFDPDKLWPMMDGWSHGEILCGIFILNVWNPGYAKQKGWEFDVFDFTGVADDENRQAFTRWVHNPVWP
jgi:hypothetical protein